MDKHYTTQAVADLLSTTERHVKELLISGELQGWKLNGRWRISESALGDYITAQSGRATRQ